MTGARQAEAEASLRLYHDGINHATARVSRAAIAVKKLEPLLRQALRGREAEALAISVLLNDLKQAIGLLRPGYTATPTGEVVKL